MLQTLGPNEDPGMRKLILADIARLRKMHKLAKQLKEYKPEPDPMQQRIQQLEIAKLEAEIEEIKSKTLENYAEAEVDRAKAANTQSETDLKNLQFVEQESGVNQERDLEKIERQSEAQAQMKREEYQLKDQSERKKELRKYLSAANE